MIRLWRAKHNNRLILSYALGTDFVSLAIAEYADEDPSHAPALLASDRIEVTDGNLAHSVAALTDKYHDFAKTKPTIIVVLAPSLYQSVKIERPNLPTEEIPQALRFNLRDLVPFAPADIIADYYEPATQLPGQNKINAVVADRKVLEPVLAELHRISDNIAGVVGEEQAVAQLFVDQEAPLAVVYQHDSEPALLQVYQQGKLQVNRVVRGLDKLSHLSVDEIELGAAGMLSVEVQRSADYFERQLRQRPITDVLLAFDSKHRQALITQIANDAGYAATWADYPSWAQELGTGDFSDYPVLGGIMLGQILRVSNAEVA